MVMIAKWHDLLFPPWSLTALFHAISCLMDALT